MSTSNITLEEYGKLKSLKQQHSNIRMACSVVILLAVIIFVYNVFNQLNTIELEETQSEVVKELTPLLPEFNQAFVNVISKNDGRIQKNIVSVFNDKRPELSASIEKEMLTFIGEFPNKAAFTIEKRLEHGVNLYLKAIETRFPLLNDDEDLKSIVSESFSEVILETQDLVDGDIHKIGESLNTFNTILNSEAVEKEIESTISEGAVQDKLIGLGLRLWAREYPGADVNYTIGKI